MEKTSHTFSSFGNSKRPVAKSSERKVRHFAAVNARLVVSNLEKNTVFWTSVWCVSCVFLLRELLGFSRLLGSKPFTKHVPELMLS